MAPAAVVVDASAKLRGAPTGLRTHVGPLSSASGGSGWPGRTHRRPQRPRHRWPRATAAKKSWEGAREAKERAAESVAVDAWLPGARRWKNDGGQAQARSGIHGGCFLKHARSTRERGRESGEASECSGSSGALLNEQGRDREAGHAATVGACSVHARRPRRQAIEQVTGTGVDKVGS